MPMILIIINININNNINNNYPLEGCAAGAPVGELERGRDAEVDHAGHHVEVRERNVP